MRSPEPASPHPGCSTARPYEPASADSKRLTERGAFLTRWAREVIVLALGVVLYINTIPNGFVFDDRVLIAGNKALHDSALHGEWLAWFGRHYWWGVPNAAVDLYRPVTILTYVANVRVLGLYPGAFHLVNLLLHAGVSVLVLAFGRRLVGYWAAFLGALLFAAHPLHTEAVAGIVGRAELLGAFFGLASLLCALHAAECSKTRRVLWAVAGVSFFFLALLSKEHVAMLPLWLALALVAKREIRLSRGPALILLAFFATVLVHFLIWRWVITAWGGPAPVDELNNATVTAPASQRWLTAAAVTLRYTWLFVWPARLSADYSHAEILLSRALGPAETAGFLLIAGVLGAAALSYRRHRGLSLVLAFVPITFSIVSNFPFAIGTIMGERLTYLPSVGICLAIGWALTRLGWPERLEAAVSLRQHRGWRTDFASAPAWRKWSVVVLCAFAVLGYSARTFVRNLDWRDNHSLFTSARAVTPRSMKVMVNLARIELYRGRPDLARAHAEEAARLGPRVAGVLVTLGDVYTALGQPERAAVYYRRAVDFATRQ